MSLRFRVFPLDAPRFHGHGLFHVLTEIEVNHSTHLKVSKPDVWEAFQKRWASHESLRLLWYAPEDEVEDDEVPEGAARYLYVSHYNDLTPRTWRYALHNNDDDAKIECVEPSSSRSTTAMGPVIKQYLIMHTVDPSVVTHDRGGVLYLLNATQECTVGSKSITESQLPITMCVVVTRKVMETARWFVAQRRFPETSRDLQLDRIALDEQYMTEPSLALTWRALIIKDPTRECLHRVAMELERWSGRKSGIFFHTATLTVYLTEDTDLALMLGIARLIVILTLHCTGNRQRTIMMANATQKQRAMLQELGLDHSVTRSALPTSVLQQLYKSVCETHTSLAAPYVVRYM